MRTRGKVHPKRLRAASDGFSSAALAPAGRLRRISRSSASSAKLILLSDTTWASSSSGLITRPLARCTAMASPGSSCPVSLTSANGIATAPSSEPITNLPLRVVR